MKLFNNENSWIAKKTFYVLFFSSFCIYSIAFILGFFLSKDIGLKVSDELGVLNSPLNYVIHNLKSAIYVASGLISFSLSTMFYLFLNGFLLGAGFMAAGIGHSFELALGSILIHGIFEIPAIVLSGGIGLYPIYIISYLLRNKQIQFKLHVKNLIFMIFLSVILFIIAAILESYVTPLVIKYISE